MNAEYMDRSMDIGPFVPEEDDNLIICRCEEITKGEIRRAIHDGLYALPEIRRYLRSGMGLCQGLTCGRLVKNILQKELSRAVPACSEPASRAPMRPIDMADYGKDV